LLPLLVVLISGNHLLPKLASLPTHDGHDDAAKEPQTASDSTSYYGSLRILAVATFSAAVVLAIYSVPTTSALGFSSTIFAAAGLVLLETTATSTEDGDTQGLYGTVSTDGAHSTRTSPHGLSREQQLAALRDVAAALTAACGLASLWLESSTRGSSSFQKTDGSDEPGWKTAHQPVMLQRILWMIPVNVLTNALMYMIVSCLLVPDMMFDALTFRSFLNTALCILLL
jgi:hypothetical protein